MKDFSRRCRLPIAVLVGVAVALIVWYARTWYPPITSWNSPRMLEIEEDWSSIRIVEWSMAEAQRVLDARADLLAWRLSMRDVRNLAATCEMVPASSDDRGFFEKAVLAHMVRVFIERQDRDRLVNLLAKRCPNRIWDYACIELYLAWDGAEMECPLSILGEAYSKCEIPEVRRDLAGAVRRAFAGLGIQGEDDGEFVENAMEWYKEEGRHLALNRRYVENEMYYPLECYEGNPRKYNRDRLGPFKRQPLFIPKSKE